MRHPTTTRTTFSVLMSALILALAQPLPVHGAASAAGPSEAISQALVQRALQEVWSRGNLSAADEVFAPAYQLHDQSTPGLALGVEGTKFLVSLYRKGFPDLQYTLEEVFNAEDEVVTRWTASGTHTGAFGLYAPTGKRMTWSGISLWRVSDGKIVEAWTSANRPDFMGQLGLDTEPRWGPSYDEFCP